MLTHPFPKAAEPAYNQSFTDIYTQYVARLRRYAHRLSHGAAAGEDLLQEASARMFTKFHLFQPNTNFFAWGARIILNTYRGECRRQTRRRRLDHMAPGHTGWLRDGHTYNQGGSNHDHDRLRSLLLRLSPRLLEAFTLRYEGLSYGEIAARLSVPTGTAKSRVHFARTELRGWASALYAE